MSTKQAITVESLESRRMFSASVFQGFLDIRGTNAADTINVSESIRLVNRNGLLRSERLIHVTETSGQITTTSQFRAADISRMMVNGFGGNDVITLNTSIGANVYAGAGNDTIIGGSGQDNLFGDMNDLGEIGIAELGSGNDFIQGNGGKDNIEGNGGNDELRGGANDDVITGGAGVDRMFGEAGNDSIFSKDGNGFEVVDGGAGTDTAQTDDFLKRITSGPLIGAFVRIRDSVFSVETVTH